MFVDNKSLETEAFATPFQFPNLGLPNLLEERTEKVINKKQQPKTTSTKTVQGNSNCSNGSAVTECS